MLYLTSNKRDRFSRPFWGSDLTSKWLFYLLSQIKHLQSPGLRYGYDFLTTSAYKPYQIFRESPISRQQLVELLQTAKDCSSFVRDNWCLILLFYYANQALDCEQWNTLWSQIFYPTKKIDWIIKIRNNLTKIFKPFWDTACFRWLDLEAVKTDVNSVKPTAFCSLITFGLEMITNFSQNLPLLYNGTLIIKILRNMEPYRGPKCFL